MESTQAERQPEDMALEEAIAGAARKGRLSCAQAFDIARRLQVPPLRVGQVADGMRIKIVACQLGCFR